MRLGATADTVPVTPSQKLWQVSWPFVLLLCFTAAIGFMMLYSAAGGSWDPWASRQVMRFGVGVAVMLAVAMVDIRFWLRYAYAIFALSLALLIAVEFIGIMGMGAQRWINLGIVQLQPSEMMKIAMVLALARCFHGATFEEIGRPIFLIAPLLIVAAPVMLVLRQPDLGTAIMLVLAGGIMFFLAGVRAWKFAVVFFGGLAALPVAWSLLHGYQRRRVLTFLNPESDPLGGGYHILQSKIALGSGGIFGKGFMNGTQSHLNFVPEKQTDFIFAMLAEEFGLVGGLVLLASYALIVIFGFAIALRVRNQFGRLLGLGVTATFFLYVFINVAMVMGLVPVVGVPLPLISYGGTAMLSVLVGFGFLLSAFVYRDLRISRHGTSEAN